MSRRAFPFARGNRTAFTLVELLVVITIIGILMSLLLPAVQSARESARRLTCSNNLRQVGIAIRAYSAQYRVFPAKGITQGPCCATKSKITWTISILPFLEQQAVYDRYDQKAFNEDPVNAFVREALMPVYACPSEPGVDLLDIPESGPGGTWGVSNKYRRGSYRANTGRSDGSGWWDSDEQGSLPLRWRGPMHVVGTGGLTWESPAAIKDGTSNTLLVGEMASHSHQSRRTFWAYSYTSYNASAVCPQSRTILTDYDRCVAIGGPGSDNACKRGWGSFHPGSLNFLICDGSVRLIQSGVDMNLLADLASIAGGEARLLPP